MQIIVFKRIQNQEFIYIIKEGEEICLAEIFEFDENNSKFQQTEYGKNFTLEKINELIKIAHEKGFWRIWPQMSNKNVFRQNSIRFYI